MQDLQRVLRPSAQDRRRLRKAKQFVIGTTGPGSSTHDLPAILKKFAGFDFKLVRGYSSSTGVVLVIELAPDRRVMSLNARSLSKSFLT
jgi:hypothetical protein